MPVFLLRGAVVVAQCKQFCSSSLNHSGSGTIQKYEINNQKFSEKFYRYHHYKTAYKV